MLSCGDYCQGDALGIDVGGRPVPVRHQMDS